MNKITLKVLINIVTACTVSETFYWKRISSMDDFMILPNQKKKKKEKKILKKSTSPSCILEESLKSCIIYIVSIQEEISAVDGKSFQ